VLVPKLVTTLRGYTRAQFAADGVAGVIVGIVALPLAIAFGIASGVTPQQGLVTAIVGGFLISALGGSRVQIGGPTGAFVVIVADVVARHGLDGLLVATMLAGALLIGLGLARLGGALKFIPRPVIVGFTSGIAVLIFSTQVRDLLGLRLASVPAEFGAKWVAYAGAVRTATPAAIALSAGALAILVFWPRVSRRVPAPFVALVAATVACTALDLRVETIGSRFGEIRAALPAPALPHLSLPLVREVFPSAITIALLAAIESLLSAVVADGMLGTRHRSNMELVAQGVANVVTPLFGGIPATGAIARTATNVRNGGRTPVAGIVHALTLLVIVLAAGGLVARIPMAALAAILVVVSYHMSEWRSFRDELRGPRGDVAVLLLTFGLTIAIDLTVAVQAGILVAALVFLRRMTAVSGVRPVGADARFGEADEDEEEGREVGWLNVPPGVQVFEVGGPFFFGAAEEFREAIGRVGAPPKVLVVEMSRVPFIDATGVHALRTVVDRSRQGGARVLLAGLRPGPRATLERAGMEEWLGADALAPDLDAAVDRARAHLAA